MNRGRRGCREHLYGLPPRTRGTKRRGVPNLTIAPWMLIHFVLCTPGIVYIISVYNYRTHYRASTSVKAGLVWLD